jgi:pimeloyl-ACP methyl ester carboxylesterase
VSQTRYARSGELQIPYELQGTLHWRRPWLVLIQGVGLDRFGWEPVLRKLRWHFRLVLVDNRGSGRSGLSAGSFDAGDMAADVLAVLDRTGVRRAHVMGASLGGMVAQELAIDHPERVDGLVLVSTIPGWPFAYPMPAVSVRLIAATRRMSRKVARRRHAENALSARSIQRHPELVDRLVELQRSHPAAPARGRPRRPRAHGTSAACGKRASAHARWSCKAPRTPSSTRVTLSCSLTASRAPSS